MNPPHSIELRHLRYLVALADAGSFTQAAERIFVAQPTLSQQIRRLEEIVGAQLLQQPDLFTAEMRASFRAVVGVGMAGFFWLTQRAVGEMAVRYGGHVVNVTATVADAADSGTPAVLVAVAKGGLAAATRSLAVEYACRGIRVNAVSPGVIQASLQVADGPDGWLPPLGRAGQVSDVVEGVLFLESSTYITGEILHVDGGQSAGGSS
jgi:NAD(P)-dependent dehydrogenase (short-subunit alcohol dehydrogenase family)